MYRDLQTAEINVKRGENMLCGAIDSRARISSCVARPIERPLADVTGCLPQPAEAMKRRNCDKQPRQ
jgi:hypothetical protein